MFGCGISNVGTMGGGSLIFGILYLGFRVAVVGLIIYLLFKLFNGGNSNNKDAWYHPIRRTISEPQCGIPSARTLPAGNLSFDRNNWRNDL